MALFSRKVDGFASPEEVASIVPYLPDAMTIQSDSCARAGDLPIEVAAPIMRKLARLEHNINTFRREHAHAFDRFHEILADEEDLVEWTVEDYVPKVFGIPHTELSIAGSLAIARFATSGGHGLFLSTVKGDIIGLWVQSKKDMWRVSQVVDWGRRYQEAAANAAVGRDVRQELQSNPLTSFITKAHQIILRSRQLRSPTTVGVLGPSAGSGGDLGLYPIHIDEILTENDKSIIRLVFETAQRRPSFLTNSARSICSLICRAIGAYPNLPLGSKTAWLLLQELGVAAPWEDRRLNHYRLRLPGLQIWPYLERLQAKVEASCEKLDEFQDSLHHVRKNWGQTPIYCIDRASTQEVDDGISTERDKKRSDCVWVHVHVANPAAYFSRDHPIARCASESLASAYTPSRNFPMMPPKFTQTFGSLAAGRPVMTISTLLEADGHVADIGISLGVVHNIVSLTPDMVAEVLGTAKARPRARLVVGGKPSVKGDEEVDKEVVRAVEKARPDLLLLNESLQRRLQKRLDGWPPEQRIRRPFHSPFCDVWTNARYEPAAHPLEKITHWKGDPVIEVEADRFPSSENEFKRQGLVEHAMLLAGESAAKWCDDRGIPVLFQVATPHPQFPVSRLNQLADADFRIEPFGRLSAKCTPHWTLSMWHYAKITSPLRRYVDLVNQWQIQAYIAATNEGSTSDTNAERFDVVGKLPFSQQELEVVAPRLSIRLPDLKQVSRWSRSHWINQALFRAFHFKEAVLPEVWDFKVSGPLLWVTEQKDKHSHLQGRLLPFIVDAELLSSAEGWELTAKRGDCLPVRIELIDPESEQIFVKAVGPPSESPTTSQPISINPFSGGG